MAKVHNSSLWFCCWHFLEGPLMSKSIFAATWWLVNWLWSSWIFTVEVLQKAFWKGYRDSLSFQKPKRKWKNWCFVALPLEGISCRKVRWRLLFFKRIWNLYQKGCLWLLVIDDELLLGNSEPSEVLSLRRRKCTLSFLFRNRNTSTFC